MILLHKPLHALLDQTEEKRAAHLTLDFAQDALDARQEKIREHLLTACLECIAAAHESLDLDAAHRMN